VLAWTGARVPLITRHAVGAGEVILSLVPGMIGQDERAHPALPYLMNGVCERLLPIEVRLADGRRPEGQVMYQLNRTKNGYLVALFNTRGVDKTQSGIARVDRRAYADIVLQTKLPIRSALEYTEPRPLTVNQAGGETKISLRVPAGDIQLVGLSPAN
jgi:hypothetical protein